MRGDTKISAYGAVYGAYLQLQRCVIFDNWKLIAYPKAGVTRLYDLKNDPLEMRDLAGEPGLTNRKKELFSKLVELQSQLGDSLELRTEK